MTGHIITAPTEMHEALQADTAHHVAQADGTPASGGTGVGSTSLPPVGTDPRAESLGKIVTSFWRKPIPTNRFDWQASRDGDEPNDNGHMRVGHGATEQEAIGELLEMEEDAGL